MECISHADLRIRSLSDDDDLTLFCSGSEELNDFLKSDALGAQNDLISRTYLCFWKEALAGFVTLTTDTIGYNLVESCDGIDGYVYQKYPAIKIARFAVDDRFERRSIGQNILLWAIGKAPPERARQEAQLQQLYAKGKHAEVLAEVEACLPKDCWK